MSVKSRLRDLGAATPLEYEFLDMRFEYPFRFNGRIFPSAENAFQSTRFSDPDMVVKFQYMSPDTAAYKGQVFRTTVKNWDTRRFELLKSVLAAKFASREMQKLLLSTAGKPIYAANVRHENDLGTCMCPRCRNRGRDLAGTALTQLRSELS